MSIKNIFIVICLVLLLIGVGPFLYRQTTLQSNSAVATPRPKKPVEVRSIEPNLKKPVHTNSRTSNEFYQPIINNNIFRPLGWKPPQETPQYTLIGTTISSDGSSRATAFILEHRSNQFHTVKAGETFGNASVKTILPKKVTLQEEGKEIVLHCGKLQFLH